MDSILVVPAHKRNFFFRARDRGASQVCWDFEDGVPNELKDMSLYEETTPFIEPGDAIRVPKEDAITCEFIQWLPPGVDVWIAMCEQPLEVDYYYRPDLNMYPLIETALGIFNLRRLVQDCRLGGLVFGSKDFGVSMVSDSADLVTHAKAEVLIAARAWEIRAIAPPSTSMEYEEVIEDAAIHRELGFDAMMAIHPDQIEAIQERALWERNDTLWARRVVEYQDRNPGEAVFNDGDNIYGPPMVKRARQILDRNL